MKRVICAQLPRPGHSIPLSDTESHHILRVLRLREGERLEALDGQGRAAVVVLRMHGGNARLEHLDPERSAVPVSVSLRPTRPLPLVIETAILKGDAMEWVVEKAVEIGAQALVPVITAHTVVQIQKKGAQAFVERWQKIADQALKQCGRLDRLEIRVPRKLEELVLEPASAGPAVRLWCDETAHGESPLLMTWLESRQPDPQTEFRVLTGPEGGWSELERELLVRGGAMVPLNRIDLGPLILRAETAVLYTASVLSAWQRSRLSGAQPPLGG